MHCTIYQCALYAGNVSSSDLHVEVFQDGMILVSNAQLELLTTTLAVPTRNFNDLVSIVCDTTPRTMRNFLALISMRLSRDANVDMSVDSCAWNMLLRFRLVYLRRSCSRLSSSPVWILFSTQQHMHRLGTTSCSTLQSQ